METVDKLEVYCDGIHVGTMAPYQKYLTAFEYSPEWLRNGFSISPFSLPLTPGVRITKAEPFQGPSGVFADSFPGFFSGCRPAYGSRGWQPLRVWSVESTPV